MPPSESIFIRCNKQGRSFLYNTEDYDYSPEIGLYVDIVLDGYDLYYSQKQDVYREPSTNPDKMKTWYYFSDRFAMIEKYKKYFGRKTYTKAKLYNTILVLTVASSIDDHKRKDLIKYLSKCVGRIMTLYCLAIVNIRRIHGE